MVEAFERDDNDALMVHDDQLYDLVNNVRTIKNILVFFAILWGIGVVILILAMIQNASSTF